jgi:hypothetical protein
MKLLHREAQTHPNKLQQFEGHSFKKELVQYRHGTPKQTLPIPTITVPISTIHRSQRHADGSTVKQHKQTIQLNKIGKAKKETLDI